MYTDPSVTDFKNTFTRDFPYGGTPDVVNDSDITAALNDVSLTINSGLFSTQVKYTYGFLLLSAHFLVINLRNSSQGIAGQHNWLTNSKAVGNVNESYAIPQRILDNPSLAMLSKTTYGAKYLMFILPQICAQTFTEFGDTKP